MAAATGDTESNESKGSSNVFQAAGQQNPVS
jgi:hypothetical protein